MNKKEQKKNKKEQRKLEYMKYLEDFVRNMNSEHRAYMRALEDLENLDNDH